MVEVEEGEKKMGLNLVRKRRWGTREGGKNERRDPGDRLGRGKLFDVYIPCLDSSAYVLDFLCLFISYRQRSRRQHRKIMYAPKKCSRLLSRG